MRAVKRLLGWPLRRALNPRVQWAIAALDERLGSDGRPPLHHRLDRLEALVDRAAGAEEVRGLGQAVAHLGAQAQTLASEASVERRATDEGFAAIFEALRQLDSGLARVEPDYQVPPLDRRRVADLTWPVAELLNWAHGSTGYAAQERLWFNPPIQLAHDLGGVNPLTVNERIVEQGFVFGALADLERGSRVLDVGGAESVMAFSLASLGHRVTVVDPGGYRLGHPLLRVCASTLDELEDDEPYDAALALSAIEHFGRPHYGLQGSDERLDLAATQALLRRVRPGGILVLTVPLGTPSVGDFQRVYDADGVLELVAGWDVRELSAAWQTGPTEWVRGEANDPTAERGVALVVARNPDG